MAYNTRMKKAIDALQRLKAGNERFVANKRDIPASANESRRSELVGGQSPFAIVLGCSDSRAPAELVFDQGLGDIFVVRVAGNIVTPSLLGSVEFSAVQHGARLVVVLGHTSCGAVQATVGELKKPSGELSTNLQSIVNRIEPSVRTLLDSGLYTDDSQLVSMATRANVRASVAQLHESLVLKDLATNDGLQIIGAEYSLETGKVEFFTEDDEEA